MLAMTDVVRAVILGIVEGLTEFLPVSSTGHMILVMPWIGIPDGDPFWNGVFNYFIQSGAILAVVIYFWTRLWRLTFRPPGSAWQDHILTKIFVAMLPAAILGPIMDDFMKAHLMTPAVVAGALIVGGFAIFAIERWGPRATWTDAAMIPLRIAFVIGVLQCLAMIPGTSRSGATIMGALLLGLTPAAAAEFSFFLAIPTLVGASLLSLVKGLDAIEPGQHLVLAVGFIVSFIVAFLVVKMFMRYIQTHRFTVFAGYRVVVGVLVAVLLVFGRYG